MDFLPVKFFSELTTTTYPVRSGGSAKMSYPYRSEHSCVYQTTKFFPSLGKGEFSVQSAHFMQERKKTFFTELASVVQRDFSKPLKALQSLFIMVLFRVPWGFIKTPL